MPDRRLQRHRAPLRPERALDLLVPEVPEMITPRGFAAWMTEAIAAVNDFAFLTLGMEGFYVCNAVTNVASRRVKQKTGAEFIGHIELAHHDGQTHAEKWRVTRENWLRRDV